MLTVEESKKEIKNESPIEKVENESTENKDTKKEIDETKNVDKVGDIEIPPPPEFSVPLFTKYINGHQRSVSISSELSNDSYLYEENGTNSPRFSIDSSGDTESMVNTEFSNDMQPQIFKKDLGQAVDPKVDIINGNPSNLNPNLLLLDDEDDEDDIIARPNLEPKEQKPLTVNTDYNHLNTGNHVPPPRSSASLSASVTRQEGIHDEIHNSAMKKAQDQDKEQGQKMEDPEKRKRAKSFKEYFFSVNAANNNNHNNDTSSSTVIEKPKRAASSSYLMNYVGSFLKKKNSYFDTDEEFWDAFLKEYRKDAELEYYLTKN